MAKEKAVIELRDVEGYRLAEDRLAELKTDLADIERAAADAESRLSIVNSVEAEAAKLIKGGAGSAAVSTIVDDSATRQRASTLRHKAAVLRKAIDMQERVLRDEENKASRLIAEAAKPAYSQIVDKIAKSLATLRELIVEEESFRNSLNDRGIKWLGTFQPQGVRGMTIDHVDYWFKEARQNGYAA